MRNPFVYGEVVPAAAFVGREDELDRLVGDLTAGQKVFLISPRRYGKSSLIRQALAAMTRRGALTVEVTVASFSSYVAFLEGYARAVVSAGTRADRARSWLRVAIRSARAEVRADAGSASLDVAFPTARTDRDIARLAGEVFALPARLASARRRRVVVALDEFQAIGGFNGGSVEHAMRAAVQHQNEVGYVFAGSEPSLMERMLGPKRPFYKEGPVMRLQKIPAA
jgi:AAA+ ATPase superfamily predicted ATPase